MLLSLCNEVIRELPFERQCEFAAKVGYDGLEIAPFTLSEEPHLLPGSRSCMVVVTSRDLLAGIVRKSAVRPPPPASPSRGCTT